MLRIVGAEHGGGVFAHRGGELVALRTIAERMIWINGLAAGRDVRIVDTPWADTKVSCEVIGRPERFGPEVARETFIVTQPPELVHELGERLEGLLAALEVGDRDEIRAALDPAVPYRAPLADAG